MISDEQLEEWEKESQYMSQSNAQPVSFTDAKIEAMGAHSKIVFLIKALRTERKCNAAMKEALEFYADAENQLIYGGEPIHKARKVLEAIEKGEHE